uniref:(northern house mosquito) hypothetical protein n=1 Tax=Culex pipiens TaxID=7175 RepID=A0A8D8GZB4_CULPI
MSNNFDDRSHDKYDILVQKRMTFVRMSHDIVVRRRTVARTTNDGRPTDFSVRATTCRQLRQISGIKTLAPLRCERENIQTLSFKAMVGEREKKIKFQRSEEKKRKSLLLLSLLFAPPHETDVFCCA